MNRQVLTNLDRMIAKLEADEDHGPQPPGNGEDGKGERMVADAG
jgi:hypothetical protein